SPPYPLSLHDALPIYRAAAINARELDIRCAQIDSQSFHHCLPSRASRWLRHGYCPSVTRHPPSTWSTWPVTNREASDRKKMTARSEEHTSELQSLAYL